MRADRRKGVKGFNVQEDECIWMKAGVVAVRFCDNAFDCRTCGFDRGMQKSLAAGKKHIPAAGKTSWSDQLKKMYTDTARPCRHALTGRIDAPKVCSYSYECYRCAYDQMLDEVEVPVPGSAPDYEMVKGFRVAKGYYYHMGHAWACFEHGGRVRVGLDDFAAKLFGPFTRITLPPLGASLKKDKAGFAFEKDDFTGAVLSPITGTVLAVNHHLKTDLQLLVDDPYHMGWLCMLEPDMPKRNLKGLYYGEESLEWTKAQARNLKSLVRTKAAHFDRPDKGTDTDTQIKILETGWDMLTDHFLGTRSQRL